MNKNIAYLIRRANQALTRKNQAAILLFEKGRISEAEMKSRLKENSQQNQKRVNQLMGD